MKTMANSPGDAISFQKITKLNFRFLDIYYVLLIGLCTYRIVHGSAPVLHQEGTACFNTVLKLECGIDEVIVLDTARYGRNDMEAAERCGVQYQQTCDVDAHFHLNKLCAGQPTCSVAVNTELFGDPCGYDEFLKVTYKCISVPAIHGTCQSVNYPVIFDHGFVESPSYPMKYYLEAHCIWHLAVQKRQTVRVTLHDFELAVKKNECDDYLLIEGVDGTTYFKDCGSLGKQTIDIDSNEAIVHFISSTHTLTQRGFFFYFEAVGPGCPDLDGIANASISYSMSSDLLSANITCDYGFVMIDQESHVTSTPIGHQYLECQGSTWNATAASCYEVLTTTPPPATSPGGVATSNVPVARRDGDPVVESASIIGIALGVVSALLLIALLIVLSLYLHRRGLFNREERRRKAERKLDQWRVVINNLQESGVPDDSFGAPSVDINKYSCGSVSAASLHSLRKGSGKRTKKNRNNHMEDEVQGRNLLSPALLDEEELYENHKNYTSVFNYDTETYRPMSASTAFGSRRSSRTGRYSLAHSRDSELDERDDEGFREPYKPPRRHRHRRSKSGVWENSINHARAAVYAQESLSSPVRQAPDRRLVITRSAPDLLEMLDAVPTTSGDESDDSYIAGGGGGGAERGMRMNNTIPLMDPERTAMYSPPRSARIGRSSTLGTMQSHRTTTPRPYTGRSNSRSKIRC